MKDWQALAEGLRVESIRCTMEAGSGHPTSCMSAADLTAVLLTNYLRYDWANPRHPGDDCLIFSKGHPCPLLYSMFNAARVITDAELPSYRACASPVAASCAGFIRRAAVAEIARRYRERPAR